MKKINSQEFRNMYLNFYKKYNHKIISEASLIPENDATVLFTTAGMQPLTPYFLGEEHPQGKRLANVQRCIRTVDIEEVGDTSHLTCFAMLGCWSLGDYWKKEAIKMSYEFLTSKDYLNIPQEKLFVTVFAGDQEIPEDKEAYDAWIEVGIEPNHIYKLPRKNNFWMLGTGVGPCGPDSEMFYDTGKEPCSENCSPACDCGKYMEIGNNVFMQYNHTQTGEYEKLTKKCIDQGMGFERNLMVLNNLNSVYDIDLFDLIKEKIYQISNVKYESNKKSYRIIMDHLRTAVFILGDNSHIVPSNTDQGYVLRRLLRRTIRHLKKLGIDHKVLAVLGEVIINQYQDWYCELLNNRTFILNNLEKEEDLFSKTLTQGTKEFNKMVERTSNQIISGEDAFRLFDTFGFPIEFTIEMAQEIEKKVDIEGYQRCYRHHQEKSRNSADQKFKGGLVDSSEINIKYHTATHILHSVLRNMFGESVEQRGSNITPERLRFDFSFERKITPEELEEIEIKVNEVINSGKEVICQETTFEDAKKMNAIGLFENKYDKGNLKVYTIDNFSTEICGGPHVKNTSELGTFKIIKEESSAAGIRRIKAVLK
ncbi:MAG: alanine--tRNA ligase [Bacilli bacterium]|jgi:alanyl-tRNA synthetase